jgi:hypothetical protein
MIVTTETTNSSETKVLLMHPAGKVQLLSIPEVFQDQINREVIVPIHQELILIVQDQIGHTVTNQDQINREVIVPMHQEQILIVQDQIGHIVTNQDQINRAVIVPMHQELILIVQDQTIHTPPRKLQGIQIQPVDTGRVIDQNLDQGLTFQGNSIRLDGLGMTNRAENEISVFEEMHPLLIAM